MASVSLLHSFTELVKWGCMVGLCLVFHCLLELSVSYTTYAAGTAATLTYVLKLISPAGAKRGKSIKKAVLYSHAHRTPAVKVLCQWPSSAGRARWSADAHDAQQIQHQMSCAEEFGLGLCLWCHPAHQVSG